MLLLPLLPLLLPLASAAPNCPYHGPAYPIPTSLPTHPLVVAAAANLTDAFETLLANTTSLISTNNSFSLQAYSTHSDDPIWTLHHTALNLDAVNSTGTREVDGDSLYRLGSVTKIFTVLTWLAEAGDELWFAPITRFVPELKGLGSQEQKDDPVRFVDWESITIGSLAGQMSGLPRDYALLGELTQDVGDNMVYVGFPPSAGLPETPPCGIGPLCNRTEFFTGLADMMPSFAPEAAPAYSNVAYILLAYALEEITGKDWLTLLRENVVEPLGLTSTYYSTPNDTSKGVIPGNATNVGWNNQLGDEGPAGSMFSSLNDLTALGKSILSSSLLPEAITRRWLRPVTFTSDPAAALGAPWGVRRINMGHPYHWTSGYQKAGTISLYSTLMILLPDYDIGFTLFNAGNMPVNMNFDFADAMGGLLLPAIHAAAREQARSAYEGTYRASGGLNSTVVISVDDEPGLKVERWISNGTDMAEVGARLYMSTTGPVVPRVRLFPTGLETKLEGGGKKVAFKATIEDESGTARPGRLFSTDCASWLTAASRGWAARSLDEFVFVLGEDGGAISVEPVALRAVLAKGEGGEVDGGDGEGGEVGEPAPEEPEPEEPEPTAGGNEEGEVGGGEVAEPEPAEPEPSAGGGEGAGVISARARGRYKRWGR